MSLPGYDVNKRKKQLTSSLVNKSSDQDDESFFILDLSSEKQTNKQNKTKENKTGIVSGL